MGVSVPLAVKVWGDFACFTRPEMKVERVSYPVMTPSAARGVLEAIFWKPQFDWLVREIHVLRDIAYFPIRRNEVNKRASPRASQGFFADDEDNRAQRNTLALRDVAYLIRADVRVRADVEESPAKFRDQFRRRVDRGQCWHLPYLGCREFSADFAPPDGSETAVDRTEQLGLMLFDIAYREDGGGEPSFFDAALDHGILRVPPGLYGEEARSASATPR